MTFQVNIIAKIFSTDPLSGVHGDALERNLLPFKIRLEEPLRAAEI